LESRTVVNDFGFLSYESWAIVATLNCWGFFTRGRRRGSGRIFDICSIFHVIVQLNVFVTNFVVHGRANRAARRALQSNKRKYQKIVPTSFCNYHGVKPEFELTSARSCFLFLDLELLSSPPPPRFRVLGAGEAALDLCLLLSEELEVLLAAPGDLRPEFFISGSGVEVPLPRFGRLLAFCERNVKN
jgi:hypothetical protein